MATITVPQQVWDQVTAALRFYSDEADVLAFWEEEDPTLTQAHPSTVDCSQKVLSTPLADFMREAKEALEAAEASARHPDCSAEKPGPGDWNNCACPVCMPPLKVVDDRPGPTQDRPQP